MCNNKPTMAILANNTIIKSPSRHIVQPKSCATCQH